MSTLNIESVLCYDDAAFEFKEGKTLVTGENSSGKTSLARILAALLSHQADPAHLGAAHRKAYVNDGRQEGMAQLDDIVWRPASGEIAVPPSAKPAATPHAVGLVDFPRNRAPKDRAKVFEGLFLPENPRDILAPAWNLPEQQLVAVLEEIENNGWDGAAKLYEARRREAKARWGKITGETYGDAKAAQWVPPNWEARLEGMSEDDLTSALTNAQDELRALTTHAAVDEAMIEAAKAVLANELPAAEAAQRKAEDENRKVRGELEKLTKRDRELEENISKIERNGRKAEAILMSEAPHTCPGCSIGLEIKDGALGRWTPPDAELVGKARDFTEKAGPAIKKFQDERAALRETIESFEEKLHETSSQVSEQRGRAAALREKAKLADAEATPQVSEAMRSKAEQVEDQAKRALEAHRRYHAARLELANVVDNDAVVRLLAPDGARGQHMRKHMGQVKEFLEWARGITGWEPIEVSDSYMITSAGRPVHLAAHNEQMKAQWLLTLASAIFSPSAWAVLDAADILDGDNWQGLVNLIDSFAEEYKAVTTRIVVCATEAELPEGWHLTQL